MPELPEVERAASVIRAISYGRTIEKVETTEDPIVFTDGITAKDFEIALTGRKIIEVGRYGKVFYLQLNGNGRSPVLHLGMTGNIQVKGESPLAYQRQSKASPEDWPPKYMKFIIHFSAEEGEGPQLAFTDPRRLGRIRLCMSPLMEPPISQLGFDPILNMCSLEEFATMVKKRSLPTKALLLDQSFSAGVGNWVADEVLYHARIHPEQRANTLTEDQIKHLHENIVFVCKTAVGVNANSDLFPENWLFKHRWGKGKKGQHSLKLPSGQGATIKWITVGGRTSAYVVELQHLGAVSSKKRREGSVSDGEERSGEQNPPKPKRRKVSSKNAVPGPEEKGTLKAEVAVEINSRRTTRVSTIRSKVELATKTRASKNRRAADTIDTQTTDNPGPSPQRRSTRRSTRKVV